MSGILTFLQFAVSFVIVLSVVVFVHEFGHYWVARRNKVRVETFSIGFGPELFGRNDRHGTRWKFSAVPLGGYVKMLGDADATSSTLDHAHDRDPDSFPSKSVWQRMAIVFAGPAANFIFAVFALAFLFAINGRPFTPPEVGTVQEGSPAAAAGLVSGDRIVAVAGSPIASFEELQTVVRDSAGQPLELTIERDGQTLAMAITPRITEIKDRLGNTHRLGQIGVAHSGVEFRKVNPLSAVSDAVVEIGNMVVGTLVALWEMIVGSRGVGELGGPIAIADLSGQIVQEGFFPALYLIAVLSVNLGLINLFPIPMLDGGHLVMYGVEALRGRPLRERTQEMAFRFGLAMVLCLMVFVTWNDLSVRKDRIVQFVSDIFS